MVDVTVIKEGWDGVGNYWPKEALVAMAKRYTAWREENARAGKPTAMPIRVGGPNGPALGHVDSMWYDISWNALRASIDCSTARLPDGWQGPTPEDMLSTAPVIALYRVVDKEDFGGPGSGYKVKEGHVARLFIKQMPQGVKMQQ